MPVLWASRLLSGIVPLADDSAIRAIYSSAQIDGQFDGRII